jgi:hypothetical protein
MTVKFIQYYDVLSGKDDEYRNFISKSYIPDINETGFLEIVGSWYLAAGEGPYHIMEGVADSVKSVHQLLLLDDFKKLNHLLHFLITNYKTKIMVPMGTIESQLPRETNFRFNHHYDINYARYDDYVRFIRKEHFPTMEKLGINMIGGWHVALGPGPSIVVEGSCASVKHILEVIGSKEYGELTSGLLAMVDGYGSKILAPTGLVP